MADFYTRPVGAHTNTPDGLTYDTAWLGITTVLWGALSTQVGPNDTLFICGTHSLSVGWTPGVSGATLGNETIIDGGYAADSGSIVYTTNVFTNARDHFIFQNLTHTHLLAATASHFYCGSLDNITFDNCTIYGGNIAINMPGIDAVTHSGLVVTNCSFTDLQRGPVSYLLTTTAATGTVSDITFTNNTITNCGLAGLDGGIHLRCESDTNNATTITNVTITENTFDSCEGILLRLVDGNMDTVGGKTVHTWTGLIVEDNTFINCGAIAAAGAIAPSGWKCIDYNYDGTYSIARNTITNQMGNVGAIDVFYSRGLIIEDNTIDTVVVEPTAGIDANGILIDFGCNGVIVRRNTVRNCLGRTDLGSTHNSGCGLMVLYDNTNIYVYGNTFDTVKHGFWYGSETLGAIANVNVFNNVFVNCTDNGIYVVPTAITPSNSNVHNNIFTGLTGSKYIEGIAGDQLVEDYNVFFGFTIVATDHTLGSNDLFTDPLLDVDYYPHLDSPCIQAGAWTGAIRLDYGGRPFKRSKPTIGAWEIANRDPTNRTARE